MSSETEHAPLHVLLIGNYQPDGQWSMRRFTDLLASGLEARGCRVRVFYPPVCIGRIGARGHGLGKWIGYIDKYLLCPFFLSRKLRSLPRDCLIHICDHSNAPYTRWIRHRPHLVTCHDLLAVRSALGEIEHNRPGWTGRQQQAMILRGLKRAQAIVSVSGATRDDVRRILGPRSDWSFVVPNALDSNFIKAARTPPDAPEAAEPTPALLPTGTRYVMHIGGEKWYKNRITVLRVFRELAPSDAGLRLVVIGPRFTSAQLEKADCGRLSERIDYPADVSDAELRAIYRAAELLIFPSRIEGFGWPVLEAQACGCPVLTLDRAPMNELNALPELRVPPRADDAEWAREAARRSLEFLDQPADARNKAIAKMKAFAARFSNDSAIDQYLEIYRHALGRPAVS